MKLCLAPDQRVSAPTSYSWGQSLGPRRAWHDRGEVPLHPRPQCCRPSTSASMGVAAPAAQPTCPSPGCKAASSHCPTRLKVTVMMLERWFEPVGPGLRQCQEGHQLTCNHLCSSHHAQGQTSQATTCLPNAFLQPGPTSPVDLNCFLMLMT